jgi:hypothetical protein
LRTASAEAREAGEARLRQGFDERRRSLYEKIRTIFQR